MLKRRFFAIPGNGSEEWDPELHGQEIDPDDMDSGVVAEVSWTPGEYSYNFGASGGDYIFTVPESLSQTYPSKNVLRGIHEFLKVVHDETYGG